jgi:hypothetical protein
MHGTTFIVVVLLALSRVVAGTVKQLIKVLLVQSCYDDDDYVRDFFMCYRQFATPEVSV